VQSEQDQAGQQTLSKPRGSQFPAEHRSGSHAEQRREQHQQGRAQLRAGVTAVEKEARHERQRR
jgi:hypothetical protein